MTAEYRIGTSGWSYRHWKGIFYPEKLGQKEWLRFYAESFDTVEINMTFYHLPAETTLRQWFDKTPDDFVFTLKAPRTITHIQRLSAVEKPLEAFYRLLEHLRQKAGCVLFQLPPSFHCTPEHMARLERMVSMLDGRYDHAIEFRHASWWRDECRALLENRCGFCTVNGLGMPPDLVVTAGFAYLRFHGARYDTLYGDDELRRCTERVSIPAEKRRLKRIYIYFNNDTLGYAVRNALTVKRLLKA